MLDLLKDYWSIVVCVATFIVGCALVKQKVHSLDDRMRKIEDMNIQVQLQKISTDLEWIKQAIKEDKHV